RGLAGPTCSSPVTCPRPTSRRGTASPPTILCAPREPCWSSAHCAAAALGPSLVIPTSSRSSCEGRDPVRRPERTVEFRPAVAKEAPVGARAAELVAVEGRHGDALFLAVELGHFVAPRVGDEGAAVEAL